MEEDTEYLKLSTEDKVQHKLWKARLKGYEEATRQFQQLDEKAPEFNRYGPLIKKFVADSNAVAQEKGLEAALVFMENAHVAGRASADVVAAVVAKAIAAPKTTTRDKARELLLMVVEIEKQEAVQEELIKGFAQKNPKVVAACIGALTLVLSSFGHTVLTLKPLVKQIPTIMEHKDKNVREEAKHLIVELHRWIGNAIKAQLSNLKPVQISELEAEFEKTAGERPRQTRWLRSQQAERERQQAAGEDEVDDDAEDDADAPEAEVDPVDLMDPVNILSQLPKDYHELLEAKKWQERKQGLTALHELVTKHPKLEAGDYAEVVKGLKRVISKDTNVMVVALAGQCMAGLARGLRKGFSPFAVACISAIIDKFKEKKTNVLSALREAADAIYPATSLEAIQEDVLGGLNNKNPTVKSETASFVARAFCYCTPAILTKKLLKAYCTELVKLLADSDPSVRDSGAEALGTALKVVGERGLTPFIADLDQLKMTKVKEASEKAELKVRVSAPKSRPAAAPANNPKPIRTAGAQAQARKSAKPGAGKKPAAKKGAAKSAPAAASAEETEPELSDEEAEQRVTELLSEDVVKQLADANWKTRLSATEEILRTVSGRSDVPAQALLKVMARKPGLKDNNFQVMKLKLEVVLQLAENASFSRRSADLCLSDCVDKLGDLKTGAGAAAVLTAVAESLSLETVSSEVLQLAFAHKSPKVQEHALTWLAKSILEFGFVIKPKPVVNYVRKALAHTNPAVRNAAVSLLGTMHLYMGATLRVLFEDEKSALLQQIDAEIERVSGEKPPAPTRGVRPAGGGGDGGGAADAEGDAPEPAAVEDLVPRVDVSDRITPELLTELADKNWKVRGEALTKVSDIVREAKFVTAALGELPAALSARCGDSNKNLAAEALRIAASLGSALGPHCKAHVRTLMPGVLTALGDNKPNIRAGALSTLNTWQEQTGFRAFCDGEILSEALGKGTPNARTELLGWMAAQMKEVSGGLPKEEMVACVPHLYTALEDRSAEVRRAAADAVLPFMIHMGFDAMARHAAKLKPASKNTVQAALDKERPNLPAKPPPKQAKAAPSKAVRSGGGMRAAQSTDSLDDEEAAAPAAKAVRSGKQARPGSKPRAGGRPTSKSGKNDDDDLSPTLAVNNLKKQRVSDEVKLKCLKWNFTAPRPEFLEQLKDQMTTAGVNKTLMTQMFHADFKQHIKAIDSLSACIDANFESVSCNLDLILKWMTLRFFDTNPAVIMKGLELILNIFMQLADYKYKMLEQEASAFIPYVIVKLGDPKDTIRASVRNIFRELYKIYPANKVFVYVMGGLASKNGRQRAECLEEVAYMIEKFALGVCQPSAGAALKEVARQIGDRDNTVRKAALSALVQAHYLTGDKLYKMIGNISDKDMSLLEERIKRAPPRAAPAPAPAERPRSCVEPPSGADHEPPPPRSLARSGSYSILPGSPRRLVLKPRQSSSSCSPRRAAAAAAAATGARPRSGLPTAGGSTLQMDHYREEESPEQPPRPRNEITEYAERLMQQHPRLPLGTEAHSNGELMQSIQHIWQQMDDIINEPPIVLPAFKHSWSKPRSQSSFHATELEQWVVQVSDPDQATVQRGIERLLTVLKSNEPEVLLEQVNSLLDSAATQFGRVLSTVEAPGQQAAPAQLCKELVGLLNTLFHYPTLSERCAVAPLQRLVGTLLSVITSSRLSELSEGDVVSSCLNKVTIRLMDRANHSNLICALVTMLHESVGGGAPGSSYQTLLMKCLWKVVRLLPEWAWTLDVPVILLQIHKFLEAFPAASWKTRASDTPLRTVKTVLHSLATIFGYQVLSKVGLIENAHRTELLAYLVKVVSSTGGEPTLKLTAPASAALSDRTQLQAGGTSTSSSSAAQKPSAKRTHDQLSEIFKMIGSKENTKEGLVRLYEFKQQNPDADIQPHMVKASRFFLNYVERGLKNIESERQRSGRPSGVAAAGAWQSWQKDQMAIQDSTKRIQQQLPGPAEDVDSVPDRHLERLKALVRRWSGPEADRLLEDVERQQQAWRSGAGSAGGGGQRRSGGLPQPQEQLQRTPPRPVVSAPASSPSPQQPKADAAELEEYRRRLAKIKGN